MLACLAFGLVQAKTEVKMVVVASFENGDDSDTQPGEFHYWVQREHMNELVPVKGEIHPVRRNAQGLYGVVPGNTNHMANGVALSLIAFVLDPRFDFSHTYWLFTGISGVDPKVGTVGTAAWASYVINGDELREFDDRETPKGWPYGLFAIGADKPNQLPSDPNHFGAASSPESLSMVFKLNPGLTNWAYDLTRNVKLRDTPDLAAERALWAGFPAAQQPPSVIKGDVLGSVRYWHGASRTKWAEDWVNLWTQGKGRFAMTNMESQLYLETMYLLAQTGQVDLNRVMVLRTASNFSEPEPGKLPLSSVGNEEPGQDAGYDSNYRAGAPVVHEILGHWSLYRDHIPAAP